MKLAWKALVVFGLVLVVIAFSLDTSVSTGGGRVHNIGLQAQQQMLLILGCVLFLGGIGLFGVAKLKQTPDEETREREAAMALKEKIRGQVAEWRATSAERVAYLEGRSRAPNVRDPNRKPFAQLAIGVLVGAFWLVVCAVGSGSLTAGGVLFFLSIACCVWPTKWKPAVRLLMLANILGALALYGALIVKSDLSLSEFAAHTSFWPATAVLILVPICVSMMVLLWLRKVAASAAATDPA